MAKLSHIFEYLLAISAQKMFRLCSASFADKLGGMAGSFMHMVMSSRREVSISNLKNAFGDDLSNLEASEITREVFKNIGRTFAEVSRFGITKPRDIFKIVKGDGKQIFDRVREEGKGALVATAHFGNWEVLGAWVASAGYETDLIVLSQHNELFDDELQKKRKSMGVGIIEVGKNIRQVFRVLSENHMVVIAADQHESTGSLIIEFFGQQASASKGPGILSVRTKAPVIPALVMRKNYDDYQLIVGEPIYPPAEGTQEDKVRKIVEMYHAFLEINIRKFPTQWLWTHRRWKI